MYSSLATKADQVRVLDSKWIACLPRSYTVGLERVSCGEQSRLERILGACPYFCSPSLPVIRLHLPPFLVRRIMRLELPITPLLTLATHLDFQTAMIIRRFSLMRKAMTSLLSVLYASTMQIA
jgi:hypothetical protein